MAVLPWRSLTRRSSPATRSRASSQGTGTNGSRPRPSVRARGAMLEPAGAHGRPGDPVLAVDRVHNAIDYG